MSKITLFALAIGCAVLTSSPLYAQDSAAKRTGVLEGPAKAQLQDIAQIDVPAGYEFIDGKRTRALLKAEGEPVSGRELGLLSPISTNEQWSVMFEFDNSGYVKDDDKNQLNADELLAAIKRGTEQANKERVRNGNPPLVIVGWEQPPKYDEATHNLEWAIRATSGDQAILNYNTRLLGRKGVMEVVLIVDADKLPQTLPAFRSLLANYSFQTGQTYAEYRPGDKVAKYGLAALILTGGAVGAAKLGLFTWLLVFFKKGFKLIIVAVVAIIASIKKVLAKIFGRRQSST
jgi:uncharacterized membrane-anchored protein